LVATQKENSDIAKQKKSLLFSTLKMATATFSSRILGLVREQVMAAMFGASGVTDAFTVAYRVPNLLRDLFAEGSFSSAFVPIFTEEYQKDPERAKRLMGTMALLLGVVTTVLSILIMIFAGDIVYLFTNEQFTSDPNRFYLTKTLVQIMAPFLVFISLAALFMGVLNTLKVFFTPSFAPVFFNILMIASMIFLPPILEARGIHAVMSLGIGVITGGLAQMLIQVPMLIKKGFFPSKMGSLKDPQIKRVFKRVGIGTIGIAATQINVLVTTILATGTVIGAVSWLGYAFRLFQFPVGILSVSIAGSNLVHFSDSWKRGNKDEAMSVLKQSFLMSFFTITPATILLFVLGKESVQIVFERGAFSAEDTMNTAYALKFYLIGLPFYGWYKLWSPTFFALDKPKLPVMISSACILFNIIFCLYFTPRLGFSALALGTSLSMILNSFIQWFYLRNILEVGFFSLWDARILKILMAGAVCFAMAWGVKTNFYDVQDSFGQRFLWFCVSGLSGAIGYFVSLLIFGEAKYLKKSIQRK
tara:strand:+ start:44009 stop:45601 length:1593 start_codon:yes stop_codon:yes gene_type:complete